MLQAVDLCNNQNSEHQLSAITTLCGTCIRGSQFVYSLYRPDCKLSPKPACVPACLQAQLACNVKSTLASDKPLHCHNCTSNQHSCSSSSFHRFNRNPGLLAILECPVDLCGQDKSAEVHGRHTHKDEDDDMSTPLAPSSLLFDPNSCSCSCDDSRYSRACSASCCEYSQGAAGRCSHGAASCVTSSSTALTIILNLQPRLPLQEAASNEIRSCALAAALNGCSSPSNSSIAVLCCESSRGHAASILVGVAAGAVTAAAGAAAGGAASYAAAPITLTTKESHDDGFWRSQNPWCADEADDDDADDDGALDSCISPLAQHLTALAAARATELSADADTGVACMSTWLFARPNSKGSAISGTGSSIYSSASTSSCTSSGQLSQQRSPPSMGSWRNSIPSALATIPSGVELPAATAADFGGLLLVGGLGSSRRGMGLSSSGREVEEEDIICML